MTEEEISRRELSCNEQDTLALAAEVRRLQQDNARLIAEVEKWKEDYFKLAQQDWRTRNEHTKMHEDNARLRGLIKETEICDETSRCPWCLAYRLKTNMHGNEEHREYCPAFTPEGEVK